jgi:hypothetical protein
LDQFRLIHISKLDVGCAVAWAVEFSSKNHALDFTDYHNRIFHPSLSSFQDGTNLF